MTEKTFTIGQIAQITGVTPKQLRFWEREDYLKDVEYLSCGRMHHRRYTQAHIDMVKSIKALMECGYTLRGAVKMAREKHEAGVSSCPQENE